MKKRIISISAICNVVFFCWIGLSVCYGTSLESYQNLRKMPEDFIDQQVANHPDKNSTNINKRHGNCIIAGFLYFDNSKFSKAEQQFSKAVNLTPKDPYDWAWLYMAQLRKNLNTSDKAIRNFIKVNASKELIYTNIAVLLGDITPVQAIEKAKASGDLGNICEANYYVAQRLMAIGKAEKAKKYLIEAIKTDQKAFWEYMSAVSWLEILSKVK